MKRESTLLTLIKKKEMPPKKGTRNINGDDGQSEQPHQQNNDEQDGEEDQHQDNYENQNQLSQILATLNSLVTRMGNLERSNANIVASNANIVARIEKLENPNQVNVNLQNNTADVTIPSTNTADPASESDIDNTPAKNPSNVNTNGTVSVNNIVESTDNISALTGDIAARTAFPATLHHQHIVREKSTIDRHKRKVVVEKDCWP